MDISDNPQLQLAYNFLHYTNKNVFLTGKAGTGKTTFLKSLQHSSTKRMVVVAPTGVSAINAGGVTIHSFFQLSFGPQLPLKDDNGTLSDKFKNHFTKNKIKLIRSLELLIIDEVSMVRADILDAIDRILRRFKRRDLPFGGTQLLLIGDLQQLAPVVKDNDRELLQEYYDTYFFFSSHALQDSKFISIELQHIYRQSEQKFIDLLNKVREDKLTSADLELLNSRYNSPFSDKEYEGYITLTTHNYQSKQINTEHLKKLPGKLHKFTCEVKGIFPASSYPADEELKLKSGSQVMFIKNDPSYEKRYYNGKLGKVTNITGTKIEVECSDTSENIIVELETWENTKYKLNENTSEIEEEIIGKFTQYPLKLAWAITIHKSQGLTFEKAIIDASQSFAHGQVYVALSRCKSLDGLILRSPLYSKSVITDTTVTSFTNHVEENQPDKDDFKKYKKEYELQLLDELFNFTIIEKKISSIIELWKDYQSSLMGNLSDELQKMLPLIHNTLSRVSEIFSNQIHRLSSSCASVTLNTHLQERLKKSSPYFSETIQKIIVTPLDRSNYETDNSRCKKRLSTQLNELNSILHIKQECLTNIKDGFILKNYIDARTKAMVSDIIKTDKKRVTTIQVNHPQFYNILLKWREETSQSSGISESQILSRKVMASISDSLPSTAISLKAIKGMGGKKMTKFGEELLSLILDYRKKKDMPIPSDVQLEINMAGLDSKGVSFFLFNQGLTASEIAHKRNLSFSTINSHLSYFVKSGQLDIHKLVTSEKCDKIEKILNNEGSDITITELKNKLGDNFSYDEIRLVKTSILSSL